MVQTGMSPSSSNRIKNSLGGGSILDSVASMLGGSSQKGGSESIMDAISGILGGGSGGAIGDALSSMLGEAGQAIKGNKNVALGGLGALVGSLVVGRGQSIKGSVKGAVGGALVAMLAAMAFNALKASGQQRARVPVGLLAPQTDTEREELEQASGLVLMAMINATKSDGQIDENELNRIAGKFNETGLDDEDRNYLMAQLQKPMETEKLIAAAKGQPELAAQIYGASLLAIEVDTQAEKNYLAKLATELGLSPQVVRRINEQFGL